MLAYTWAYPGPPLSSRAARKIPKKSGHHFVGQLTFGEENGRGQCLVFESKLEHDAALSLIYRPGIVDVIDQVGPVHYLKANGRAGRHFIDYVAVEEGGRRTGVVVKPYRRAERTDFRADIARVAAAAIPTVVDRLVIFTEQMIDRGTLALHSQFHAARFAQPEFDVLLEAATRTVIPTMPLRDLLDDLGVGAVGFHAALRQIRFGRLWSQDPGLVKMSSHVCSRSFA